MFNAWMSVLTLYNWDESLFSNFRIPEKLDKATLVRNLLLETAELEVIYPDPEILKQAISVWSNSRLHTWEKICEVLYLEYDPLTNIRRDEIRTIKSTGASSSNGSSSSSGSSVDQVSAWNDSDFANRGKTDDSGKTDTTNKSDTTHETVETLHIEGDSAITDAQDVIRKEIDVRIQYDMYRIILNEFKERFCVMVY